MWWPTAPPFKSVQLRSKTRNKNNYTLYSNAELSWNNQFITVSSVSPLSSARNAAHTAVNNEPLLRYFPNTGRQNLRQCWILLLLFGTLCGYVANVPIVQCYLWCSGLFFEYLVVGWNFTNSNRKWYSIWILNTATLQALYIKHIFYYYVFCYIHTYAWAFF